ncbi:DUF456 family protein [Niallia taxi]|uniref:DUF456 family protein n=1 Tax=Niallia taxi TaxID=2499688 RepID=A0A3S2UGS4_9BACI|nr:DUF456 family protein [Niallia taxi]MCM3215367.1 DUF456 family protein [Niallia taxi]MDK8639668.1 DUF456 family protein [Niallia taxi]MED4038042.1 DUF456 family protein [Niallia taxi]MED4055551.1 DUF456 family protein [Niallia taxi]MED4117742.1 DUF456 family protein [Niallia taxi]
MDIIYWVIIVALFIVAYIGLVYPIIPSVIFIIGGFLLYGLFFTFQEFSLLFWIVQGVFVILLFIADYMTNLISVKKYGGSKAGIWGSTIGLLAGPFLIPVAGILIGPFVGAVIAELLVNKSHWKAALKAGVGSLVGFLGSVAAKGLIQTIMIVYFLVAI